MTEKKQRKKKAPLALKEGERDFTARVTYDKCEILKDGTPVLSMNYNEFRVFRRNLLEGMREFRADAEELKAEAQAAKIDERVEKLLARKKELLG